MPPDAPFCPRCFAAVSAGGACGGCGLEFARVGGVLDLIDRDAREARAAEVERFYSKSPFPGYAPDDTGPGLIDRCRAAPFLDALDRSIGPEERVLDCGCGTAQLASFLALAAPRRQVVGIDGCRESLVHADGFRSRAGIANLQLVRADLFDLPVEPESFRYVISRGVVHHTPDPDRAIAEVARRVAPGGYLVLGFYETRARLFHCARRALGKLVGRPIALLDPILRRRDLDPEKKRIWIDDQYHHPLEHILALPHVLAVLRELGFGWLRTIPPACDGETAFAATPEPGALGLAALRLGWALRGTTDPDAGLVAVVAQRQSRT